MLIIMPANEFLEKAMLNSGYVCENHKVIIGKTNNLKKLVALFALILVYIFYLAWGSILTPITPDGDFAADMLLANRIADEGYLLVGHYSRWGFNHPGPFWFYYNEFMEIILKWIFPSRWVDWLVGGALINAFFIAFSTFSLSTYFLGRFNLTCTVLSAYLLLGFVGAEISIIWMPYRLITPYFAFLVCVLHILSGNFKYILASTFIVCILIHGYATMPFVTLPILGGGYCLDAFRIKK